MKFIKNLFLFLVIMFLFLSCASDANVKKEDTQENSEFLMNIIDDTTIQKVFDVTADKTTIFNKIVEFIPTKFRNEKSKIYTKDLENGIISGSGNLVVTITTTFIFEQKGTNEFFFDYKFEIKDNKYRLTITNPYWFATIITENTSNIEKKYGTGKMAMDQWRNGLRDNGILKDIKEFVEGSKKQDKNW